MQGTVMTSQRKSAASVFGMVLIAASSYAISAPGPGSESIRPYRVEVPQAQIDDMRRRIVATRLPSKALVEARSQGVQVATVKALANYWAREYAWREGA